MASLHQLLVPVDGSQTSVKALEAAIELARLNGARLRLLYVIDELDCINGFETARAYHEQALPLMHTDGERLLAQMRSLAEEKGVMCDSVLLEAGAERLCDVVAEHARLVRADMIVLGSHGRRGLNRVLMGSDAEQIVRHAPVAVLVVKA
ncbi:universal stress protein UspA-like protein [Polaromonas sp. CF318]|uniref:universal stress protein n=1 Tax=Polaromonas sp. CF318 TaxID=1144318 RepID=UPI00027100D4|nr:universal stress protein [Polaromonas sp. CF318]EJL88489.1 universal stress protein UspA-like protein [Polaromonas sp. CF318]